LQTTTDGRVEVVARSVMATAESAVGRLIRLIAKAKLASPLTRYVVYRTESSSLSRIATFREWSIEAAAATAEWVLP
jgi:DNA-binding transcriptional LysR family regulator